MNPESGVPSGEIEDCCDNPHHCLREATDAEGMLGLDIREVTFAEVREGDHVAVTGIAVAVGPDSVTVLRAEGNTFTLDTLSNPTGVTVTRREAPLPRRPGSVGTATVRGFKGVRVMRVYSSERGSQCWISPDAVLQPNCWVWSGEITDYVPELGEPDRPIRLDSTHGSDDL